MRLPRSAATAWAIIFWSMVPKLCSMPWVPLAKGSKRKSAMASWMLRAACLLNSSSVSLVFLACSSMSCCFSAILIWASVMRLRASSSRSSTAIWSSPAPSSLAWARGVLEAGLGDDGDLGGGEAVEVGLLFQAAGLFVQAVEPGAELLLGLVGGGGLDFHGAIDLVVGDQGLGLAEDQFLLAGGGLDGAGVELLLDADQLLLGLGELAGGLHVEGHHRQFLVEVGDEGGGGSASVRPMPVLPSLPKFCLFNAVLLGASGGRRMGS